MRGEIIQFDDGAGTGLISGDDGQRYGFDRADLASPATLTPGLRVDFSPEADRATRILLIQAAASPWASGASTANAYPPAQGSVSGSTAIDWKHLLFSFDGRIRRTHYWIGWAVTFGAGLVLSVIPILNLLGLLLLWPTFAIAAKRFHDMGRTGWLIAIPYVVQIVAFIYLIASLGVAAFSDPDRFENMEPQQALALIGPGIGILMLAMVIALGFWLWMGIADSQRGENRFGPNPKNPVDASVFN